MKFLGGQKVIIIIILYIDVHLCNTHVHIYIYLQCNCSILEIKLFKEKNTPLNKARDLENFIPTIM